jgi:hypothetical protein
VVSGSIESAGAQDHYTFTAGQGEQVYLDVSECAATGTLDWTLLRPDDEPVFQDETMCDTTTPSNQEVILPQAGDYRLIVSGRDAATGTYRVTTQSR